MVSIFLPPYTEWRAAFNFTCALLACILGVVAAASGRRWWLIIPGTIVTGFGLALYLSAALF